MSLHRIFGIVLRFIYAFKYSIERITDAFYFPIIELTIWGLASSYFKSINPNASPIIVMIISGIVFWILLWRAQYEINFNVLGDIWNKNLINIFISPLKFSEWVLAFIILGLIKAIASISFAIFIAFILYKVKILSYGFEIIPLAFLLLLTGWWNGFFISGLILRFGRKVDAFAWTLGALLVPFSAIYYPVAILPDWAQKIALLLPTSYVFEALRGVISGGNLDWNKVLISFVLNIFYFCLAFIFFKRSFEHAKRNGLLNLF